MNINKEIYCSVVMVYYNQVQLTIQTLATLVASLEPNIIEKGLEIILVDNGSTDYIKLPDYLNNDNNIRLEIVRLDQNMGYPIGMNEGIAKCNGQVIIVINNDLIFTRGWLPPLLEVLESESDIGAVSPMISNASGIQHIDFYSADLSEIHVKAKEFMRRECGCFDTNRIVGTCMVMKRVVLNAVGGNDFWFGPGYYDDDDWCLRICIAGFKLYVVKASFVYHIGSVSFLSEGFVLGEWIQSQQAKFLRKWHMRTIDERHEVLSKRHYAKEDYYIPIKFEEFLPFVDKREKEGLLIVADWDNKNQNWQGVLIELLKNSVKEKCYLWIPSNYYEPKQFNLPGNFFCITQLIPQNQILQFINLFKAIVKIENDFINSYLVTMFNRINKY